jgi:hypothetical protein
MADISLQGLNAYNSNSDPFAPQRVAAQATETKPQETEKAAEQPAQAPQSDNSRMFDKINFSENKADLGNFLRLANERMKSGVMQISALSGNSGNTGSNSLDSLRSAVSDFKDGYNAMMDAAKNSDDEGVLAIGVAMATRTGMYGNALSEIGVTTDEENKMQFDPEAFIEESKKIAKELFSGGYSYGEKTISDFQKYLDSIINATYNNQGQSDSGLTVAGLM